MRTKLTASMLLLFSICANAQDAPLVRQPTKAKLLTSKATTANHASQTKLRSKPILAKLTLEESVTPAGATPKGYKPVLAFATASPNFQRVAFTAEREDEKRRLAVVDGKVHPEYLIVNEVLFSPDSKRVMYKAVPGSGQPHRLYVDGKLHKIGNTIKSLQFTKDSKHYVYVSSRIPQRIGSLLDVPSTVMWDGSPTSEFPFITSIRFGNDSKTFAFGAVKNRRPVVVVNNRVVGSYDMLPDFPFSPAPHISPNGKRTAFHAKRGSGWLVVTDGVEDRQRFAEVHGIKFSPDSNNLAFVGKDFNGYRLFLNNKPISESYQVVYRPLVFSSDSKRLATIAKSSRGQTVLMDGKSRGFHDDIGRVVFSADSRNFAYWAKQGDDHRVVVNGSPGKSRQDFGLTPVFSPDSRNLAYAVKEADKFAVIVNETTIDRVDELDPKAFQFSPDSSKLAYWARIEKEWFLCVNGIRSKHSFAETVGARPNVFDIENYQAPRLKFNGDDQLLAVGFKENQFFKIAMQLRTKP